MRTNKILARLKFILLGVGNSGNGQMMSCQFCNSVNIKKISEEDNPNDYRSLCMCMRCGAICYENQYWYKEGEEDKKEWEKTGNHYNIQHILDQMKEHEVKE